MIAIGIKKYEGTYRSIQALRFFAAILVVLAHSTGMVGERILQLKGEHFWRPGMSGVDIFFVISGFVMAMSSQKLIQRSNAWLIFIKTRLIRIVPLYWFATTLKVILVLAIPSMALNTPIEFWHVLTSYFFIPTFTAMGNFDFPVLKVGWTLVYEMFFYIIFSFALFIKRPPLLVSASVFFVCTLINIFSNEEVPFFYGFLNPIMLEFVMGMFLARLCSQGYTIRPLLGFFVIVISFAIMFSVGDFPIWWRWIFWGVPSMMIVGSLVMLESTLHEKVPNILVGLGNSSYSLYLFHTFSVPLLGVIFLKSNFKNSFFIVIACLIISTIISHAIYKIFELPFTNWLKSKIFPIAASNRVLIT